VPSLEIKLGPPQLAIHQSHAVLLSELDGQINWPSEKGLYLYDTRVIRSCTVYANGEAWDLLNGGTTTSLAARVKQEQITEHFCIQGRSSVAKWGGVRMRDILDTVRPTREARYAVFYSFAEGADGGIYYDVHNLGNMRYSLTILAYEIIGSSLPLIHGAPLRLQDGQVDPGHRIRARLRASWLRRRAAATPDDLPRAAPWPRVTNHTS
jgi:hypothetical protein